MPPTRTPSHTIASRFLEAAGVNRDWPTARGIFHDDDKTILMWINGEDHLRIISLQQGADVTAVLTKLAQVCLSAPTYWN